MRLQKGIYLYSTSFYDGESYRTIGKITNNKDVNKYSYRINGIAIKKETMKLYSTTEANNKYFL